MPVLTASLLTAALLAVPQAPAAAASAPAAGQPALPAGRAPAHDPSSVDPADRDAVLPAGWRTSGDMLWTTAGDSTGFHLLVAESATGYSWRTAATLAEPWLDADQWIGNACLTGSGRRAVVVYAPRYFTNRANLYDRGAFAAVVDLADGHVTKLAVNVSLAYYDPGCGTGETAVLTQSGVVDMGRTRLHELDTARGVITRTHDLAGEITSAVPVGDHIVAAQGARLVRVDATGPPRLLASTGTVPFRVHPDGAGGVVFMDRNGGQAQVKRLVGTAVTELARSPWMAMRVEPGTGGRVFITGAPQAVRALPATVRTVDVAVGAEVSTAGAVGLAHTAAAPGTKGIAPDRIVLRAKVPATGRALDFTLDATARPGTHLAEGDAVSPALTGGAAPAAESPSNPVDNDRTCSIPRNDARTQVYQPHWSQVEWAANLAVQRALTITRPANWKQSGMPSSWSPQQMFPGHELSGGGRIPAQILLGVLAQESNLWQASGHAAEGTTGNPLVGSFYGSRDGWGISWSDADCGYGVSQLTDGMRLAGRTKPGETALDPSVQRAVAVDYATNIAAGAQKLQEKWNQTYDMGIRVNNADPFSIESWAAALWAYNSGINPQASTGGTGCTPSPTCNDGQGNWGLGWTNNPARPDYPADRTPFLDDNHYDDARNPQQWPYEEKVIGWAAYPIIKYTGGNGYEGGYQQAWWISAEDRTHAKPPLQTFCAPDATNGNLCNPDRIGTSTNPCTRTDFHCWWHSAAFWKDCAGSSICGHEADHITAPGTPEPPDADAAGAYQDESRSRLLPNCALSGLPSGALLIDDVPDSVPSVRPNCSRSWTSSGSFTLNFAQYTDGLYHSKVDFHQIGAGFGAHYWFTHTRNSGDTASRYKAVTGTWTLNRTLNQWARVLVHLPEGGAHSQQAPYTVNLGNGQSRQRVLLQKIGHNGWVSLGAFPFAGTPSVSLSNITADGDGSQDIAYDAIAFQPLAGKPAEQLVVLGDSYSSGEGAAQDARTDYYAETDDAGFGGSAYRNGCHRSRYAWSRQAVLPGVTQQTGTRADQFDPSLDYHLLACSGARTENLLPPGATNAWGRQSAGQFREKSQLAQGYLDGDTTTVALTIGGNDAHFSDVLRMCSILGSPSPLDDCGDIPVQDDWFGDGVTGLPLRQTLPALINSKVRSSVDTVLRAVHTQAPNARIVLAGYPRLTPPNGPDRWPDCYANPGFSPFDMDFLNDMSDVLNGVLMDEVAALTKEGIRILYSDPRDEFELKNACSHNEHIHEIILDKTAGEEPGPGVSQQSFHPTIAGNGDYAAAYVHTLNSLGPGNGPVVPPGKDVALAELGELRDNPAGSTTGYSPSLFGYPMRMDSSCDTRNVILRRDGNSVVSAADCKVTAGHWTSPYDNTVHTSPSTLDIDHTVPLGNAWISGASDWPAERRLTFGNDPEHPQLIAVSSSSNRSKGDRPPDVWLPATTYLCLYARSWVHVKHIYHLNATQSEYDTLREILQTYC